MIVVGLIPGALAVKAPPALEVGDADAADVGVAAGAVVAELDPLLEPQAETTIAATPAMTTALRQGRNITEVTPL